MHAHNGDVFIRPSSDYVRRQERMKREQSEDQSEPERIIWQGFPSWEQFSWLYFFCLLAAFHGLPLFRFGLFRWDMWIVGAVTLLMVAFLLRRWALYILTPTRLTIRNRYTGHVIDMGKLEKIQSITLHEGPIARMWGIGTFVIRTEEKDRVLRLRGIKNPDVVEAKIKALLPFVLGPS